MKITKVDSAIDRKIITAMVVSDRFIRDCRDIYAPELFTAEYARIVSEWCVEFFDKYKHAPRKHIRDLYEKHVKTNRRLQKDKALAETVKLFLQGISHDYDATGGEAGLNVSFLLDETERWAQKRNLENLTNDIQTALRSGDVDEADQLQRTYQRIERAQDDGFDPLRDEQRIKAMFDAPLNPLLHMPGAFGEMVDNENTEDQCIGIMGPEKSGKTFELTEWTKRAAFARCDVALFETGDLSESQIMRRLHSNLTGKPTSQKWCSPKMLCVADCWLHQTAQCCVKGHVEVAPIRSEADLRVPEAPTNYKPCPHVKSCKQCRPTVTSKMMQWPTPMCLADVHVSRKNLMKHMGPSRIKVVVRPNNTLTCEEINNILTRWKSKQGYTPRVIVIDYADILAKERGISDNREAEFERWKWFRRISQEWRCLVVVATQTNAQAYGRENLTRSNFSEDHRKYAQVTGMLAIHQTAVEHQLGLARMSWMLGRELEYGVNDQVVTVQHLRIGRPIVSSFWRDKTYKPKNLIDQNTEEGDDE